MSDERTATAFVYTALTAAGSRYVFAAQPGPDQVHPSAFDCSGLTRWAALRCGLFLPQGSWNQAAYCRDHGTLISEAEAASTLGALAFAGPDHGYQGFGPSGHVVISLGNGRTIEARGTAYGVGSWSIYGRGFDNWALVPGCAYDGKLNRVVDPPPASDWAAVAAVVAACKQTVLRRGATGQVVWALQAELNQRAGLGVRVDGIFGAQTEQAVRAFQAAHRLQVDGVVGPQSWSVLLPS